MFLVRGISSLSLPKTTFHGCNAMIKYKLKKRRSFAFANIAWRVSAVIGEMPRPGSPRPALAIISVEKIVRVEKIIDQQLVDGRVFLAFTPLHPKNLGLRSHSRLRPCATTYGLEIPFSPFFFYRDAVRIRSLSGYRQLVYSIYPAYIPPQRMRLFCFEQQSFLFQ